MNIKKYKVLDLLLLTVIGIATELVGCWLINIFLPWVVPIFTSSVVVIIVAMVRWGPIGIIIAPVLALASYISDLFFLQNSNNMQMPVSYFVNLAFLLCVSIFIPFCIKGKADKSVNTLGKRVLLVILIYILGSIVCGLIYGFYGLNIFISMGAVASQQLMSLIITGIFLDLLFRQDVLVNVKNRFLAQKKEIEEEKKYYNSRKE